MLYPERTRVERLRTCIVAPGLKAPSGSYRYVEGLVSGLRRVTVDSTLTYAVLNGSGARVVDRLGTASRAFLGWPDVLTLMHTRGINAEVSHVVESVSVPQARGVPLVVTVHDMAALLEPWLVPVKLSALTRASWRRRGSWAGVIVPSAATADDVSAAGFPRNRIWVVPYGLDPRFSAHPSPVTRHRVARATDDRPYLLHVAPPSRKKGTDMLLRAWAKVVTSTPGRNALLVWVSRAAVPGRWLAIAGRAAQYVRVLKSVPDDELVALYSRSHGVVVPSRWEGFSFPVSEGLAQGVPILASNIRVHRERQAPGVYLHGVDSSDELASLMIEALAGTLQAPRVRYPGWDQVAREHLAVYRDVSE